MTKFTDKMDHSTKISLYEYQIIRNPKTDKCVICTNTYMLNCSYGIVNNTVKPNIRVEYITFDEVKEALEEVNDGYFNFIGSTREKELKNLDNDYLTRHIYPLEQWNGYFQLSVQKRR